MKHLESCNRWHRLGLELGLLFSTLERIKLDNATVEDCMMAMLNAWLSKQDHVGLKGSPTYKQLIRALRSISEDNVADKMEKELVRISRKRPSSATPGTRDPKSLRKK